MKPLKWLRAALLASVIVPTLFFGGIAWETHAIAYREADQQILSTVKLLGEEAGKVMQTSELVTTVIDGFLDNMAWDEIAHSDYIHHELQRLEQTVPEVNSIVLVAPDGTIVNSSRAFPVSPVNISNRSHYKALRDGLTDSFITSRYFGQVSHEMQFSVASRRRSSDGKFNGIIVVSNSTGYFEDIFGEIKSSVSMFLVRSDGEVLASIPAAPNRITVPKDLLGKIMSSQLLLDSTPSPITSADSRGAFRQIHGYPLAVGYTQSNAAIQRVWLTSTLPYGMVIGAGVIAVVFVICIAMRAITREDEARSQLNVAEQKMHQAQRMEALGQLTAGVAHDFNNLMAVILSNVELLLINSSNGVQRRRGDAILAATQRGSSLIRQLLAFARRQMLSPELRDVNNDLMKMTVMLLPALIETIKLELKLCDCAMPCLIDTSEFELAVLNIATNARQAMPNGGQFVVTTTLIEPLELELVPGNYLRISFSDTGHGMGDDVLSRVFEPFFTTRLVGEGTGLGLSHVYGFCKQSGGIATIESAVSHGTVVNMYLPIAKNAQDSQLFEGSMPRKILVVDDTVDILQTIADILQETGWEVMRATNASEALEILHDRGTDIALLLTDVVMPGSISGIELATRAKDIYPQLRVLLMSGYTDMQTSGGSLPLLRKPFRINDLITAVNSVIEGGRLGRWR